MPNSDKQQIAEILRPYLWNNPEFSKVVDSIYDIFEEKE